MFGASCSFEGEPLGLHQEGKCLRRCQGRVCGRSDWICEARGEKRALQAGILRAGSVEVRVETRARSREDGVEV